MTLIGILNDNSSLSASDEPTIGSGFTNRRGAVSTNIGAFMVETIGVSATQDANGHAVTGTDHFITIGIAIANTGITNNQLMWVKG